MGFHRPGNKKTAAIGRDILLVESFLEHGYVMEVQNQSGTKLQCRHDSPKLNNVNYEKTGEIHHKQNLRLTELSFEEAKKEAKKS